MVQSRRLSPCGGYGGSLPAFPATSTGTTCPRRHLPTLPCRPRMAFLYLNRPAAGDLGRYVAHYPPPPTGGGWMLRTVLTVPYTHLPLLLPPPPIYPITDTVTTALPLQPPLLPAFYTLPPRIPPSSRACRVLTRPFHTHTALTYLDACRAVGRGTAALHLRRLPPTRDDCFARTACMLDPLPAPPDPTAYRCCGRTRSWNTLPDISTRVRLPRLPPFDASTPYFVPEQ